MQVRLPLILTIVALLCAATVFAQSSDIAVRQQLESQGRVDNVLLNDKGLPSFIRCDLDYSDRGADALERAWAFLDANATIFRMTDPRAVLKLYKLQTDERGNSHVKFSQLYHGLPVFQGQVFVHVSAAGHITAVNGNFVEGISVDITPAISVERAEEIMAQNLGLRQQDCEFAHESLTVVEKEGHHYLAWRATAESKVTDNGADCFVDAKTGTMLLRYPTVVE